MASRTQMRDRSRLSFFFSLAKVRVEFLRELTKLEAVIFGEVKSLLKAVNGLASLWGRRGRSGRLQSGWGFRTSHQHLVKSKPTFKFLLRVGKVC